MMHSDFHATALPSCLCRYIIAMLIVSILCLSASAVAAEGFKGEIIEIVAEGKSVLGDQTTPAQAKAMALNDARRIAMEKASGVLVSSSSVVYQSQLVSDMISAFSKGLIIKEDILFSGMRTENKQTEYICRIKARIKPLTQERDKEIQIVKAELARADRPFSTTIPVFQDNDEIRIRLQTQGDAVMSIFSVSQDGRVTCLFPNPYIERKSLPSREEFIFPDDALRKTGFKLRVRVPQHLSQAYETIIVIATKKEKNFLSGKIEEATLSDLMGELAQVDQDSWADAVIGYEVRR